jgi:hypothetical protein
VSDVDEVPGELLEVVPRRRRTGVIVGLDTTIPTAAAIAIQRELAERFPAVTVACVPATSSVAFEWDEDEA